QSVERRAKPRWALRDCRRNRREHLLLGRETGRQLQRLAGHADEVTWVAFSPDGSAVLSASRDMSLCRWDWATGRLIQRYRGHTDWVWCAVFSPDGRHLATASMDKSIKVWDAAEFRLLKVIDKARHAGHGTSVNKLLWSAYQNQLVSCSDDRSISVWDISFAAQDGPLGTPAVP
ncbi:MAG: hypothetical protein HC842_09800, partial [Cytophagales bacterium]|nr:hypothetical protein [Cytophagales bacterium]